MISVIQNSSLVTLLGLEEADPQEVDQLLNEMSDTISALALTRLEEDMTLTEEERNNLKNLINFETNVQNFNIELQNKYPKLPQLIEEEAYIFKKTALVDQLRTTKESIESSEELDNKEELLKIIIAVNNLLETDNPVDDLEFESKWLIYLDSKI